MLGSQKKFTPLLLVFGALLSGCETTNDLRTQADHGEVARRAEQANRQLRENVPPAHVLLREDLPRFARRSIPLDRAHMLPHNIGLVTLQLPGRHNVRTAASHIERLTKLPVILSTDALLPASEFAPPSVGTKVTRQSGRAEGPAPAGASSTPSDTTRSVALAVEKAGAVRQWEPLLGPDDSVELNYRGTLAGLLDHVASQAQLQWMYANGQIRFYRLVTRSISVKALPGSMTQAGSLTLATGLGSVAVSNSSDANVWAAVEKTVASMISGMGTVEVDPVLGTVNVTDALPNVQAIETYIESINRQMLRQVSLTVEVLQVALNSSSEAGIDWSAVMSSGRLGTFSASNSSPMASSATAGVISLVRTGGGNDLSLFIRALERFGRVSTSYSGVITTMNRQPVPLGSISTRSYLKQVAPVQTTNAAGATVYGPPALTPGEVSTGFTMSLLPVVLDSNRVMLQCTINISSLKELTTFSSGTGAAQQTIQQPSVNSFATHQRMAVQSGDTIVLSGFENETSDTQQTDVIRKAIPGSRSNLRDKTTLVVLITPRLLEY